VLGSFGRRRIALPPGGFTRLGGRLGRGALLVIAVELAAFLAYAFADGPALLRDHVALTPGRVWHEPWQLLSSLLLHVDARDAIGSLLGVWIFGGPLERLWGPFGLCRFLFGTGLLANLAMALCGGPATVGGIAPSAVALVVAFGFVFAEPYVHLYGLLPLRGKHLCWIVLGATALSSLTGALGVHTVGLAAGGVAGAFHVNGLSRPSGLLARLSRWRARRRLRLVPGRRPPRYWN
jgi:rhomboid family protein